MATEENKALVRRFVQVRGKGSLDTVDELAAPDFSVYYPLLRETVHGPEAFKQVLMGVHAGLPASNANSSSRGEKPAPTTGAGPVTALQFDGLTTCSLQHTLAFPTREQHAATVRTARPLLLGLPTPLSAGAFPCRILHQTRS